jgi:hypothetical protein
MSLAAPVAEQRLDALVVMREAGVDGIAWRGGLDFGLVLDSVSLTASPARVFPRRRRSSTEFGGRI